VQGRPGLRYEPGMSAGSGRSPLEIARARLGAFIEARPASVLAIAHGAGPEDPAVRAATRARAALGTGELREALDGVISLRLESDASVGAMLAHLALAARDEVVARAGIAVIRAETTIAIEGEPRALGAVLADALTARDPLARSTAAAAISRVVAGDRALRGEALDEARAIEGRIRARGPRAPDDPPEDLGARAARFLDETDDAMGEAIARAAHVCSARDLRSTADVLAMLRAPALDPLVASRTTTIAERARRIAAFFAPLGLDADLARARLERVHVALDPDAMVLPLDPPRRVAIVPSSLELGVASELALVRGIGAGLAMSMVAPALPIELRTSPCSSVARALGDLIAGLHADVRAVTRLRSLDGTAAEALRRVSAAQILARARASAARVLSVRDAADVRGERLARALGASPSPLSTLLADAIPLDPERDGAELRSALAALAAHDALRDQLDEDWYRNPRAASTIRASAARGGALSAEDWAVELGADVSRARSRALELAR
jgi:hypothetical protein